MIFVFDEGGTLDIIKGLAEARRNYEGIDVESGTFIFFNEKGQYLKPVFTKPNRFARSMGVFPWVVSDEFELHLDPKANVDNIFVCMEETSILSPNPWFRDLGEVKNFLSKALSRRCEDRGFE